MSLEVGNKIPDFSLIADNGKPYKLSSKIKNKALLVFYPGDGTPVCKNQFFGYKKSVKKFNDANVEIIGITSNDHHTNKSFKEELQLPFVLLSDSDVKIAKQFDCYGLFGVKRGVFLINKDLELKYSHVESVSIFQRTADELLDSIKKYG